MNIILRKTGLGFITLPHAKLLAEQVRELLQPGEDQGSAGPFFDDENDAGDRSGLVELAAGATTVQRSTDDLLDRLTLLWSPAFDPGGDDRPSTLISKARHFARASLGYSQIPFAEESISDQSFHLLRAELINQYATKYFDSARSNLTYPVTAVALGIDEALRATVKSVPLYRPGYHQYSPGASFDSSKQVDVDVPQPWEASEGDDQAAWGTVEAGVEERDEPRRSG